VFQQVLLLQRPLSTPLLPVSPPPHAGDHLCAMLVQGGKAEAALTLCKEIASRAPQVGGSLQLPPRLTSLLAQARAGRESLSSTAD
jgi:hypothetical protein